MFYVPVNSYGHVYIVGICVPCILLFFIILMILQLNCVTIAFENR